MSSHLAQAAEWLYQLNPTMLKVPPRATDEEYCFMGPDGGTEGAVTCREIGYAHATCVGSWMLPPEYHIVEGIAVTLVALVVLHLVAPSLKALIDTKTCKIQHPRGSRAASLFCFGMVMIYKVFGYPKRIFYIVMPCNMQWALSFLQCFLIPESWTILQYTVLQLRISYIVSVIIAIVTPETEDCVLPGEYVFYWINHAILLILPAAYIANGSVSCFPPSDSTMSTRTFNLLWLAYSCAAFAIFYFIPVVLLAIYSGLNLNFMMHPPHDHFALKGQYYRLTSIALLSTLFGVSRLLAVGFEKAYKGSSSADKKKTS